MTKPRRAAASSNQDPLARLREICLALPEATEQVFGGHTTPTWRVRDKIFAMFSEEEGTRGRFSVWCKAAPGAQHVLISGDPAHFFSPRYVGPKGWVGVYLDASAPWDVVEELVRDSYRLIAPKRLAATLDANIVPVTGGQASRKQRRGARR